MVEFVREDEDEDGDIEMSFLRQCHKVANKFIMPKTADIGMVKRVQVKVILPDPIGTGVVCLWFSPSAKSVRLKDRDYDVTPYIIAHLCAKSVTGR